MARSRKPMTQPRDSAGSFVSTAPLHAPSTEFEDLALPLMKRLLGKDVARPSLLACLFVDSVIAASIIDEVTRVTCVKAVGDLATALARRNTLPLGAGRVDVEIKPSLVENIQAARKWVSNVSQRFRCGIELCSQIRLAEYEIDPEQEKSKRSSELANARPKVHVVSPPS